MAPWRALALGRGLATTTALFSRRMQDAIEGRLRGKIPLLIIQQPRNNLRRRQAGKLRSVADIQHRLAFFVRQGMAGLGRVA